ncbi:hypothetical protein [Pantoea coffeiphila]|uniref:hypothetical protein n=1 Tax=Pantoea coffeiphila TaxID=1465635 RepID=UPI001960CAFF|nr:hypothetical protein [Pantoea coffeiphila]MBM7346191.1 putative lipoprotein [Pantoea coffeiphila]
MGRVFITEGVRTGPDGSGYSCEDDDERADSWDVVDSDSGAKYFGSEDYSTATRVSGVLNAICREHAAEVARLNEQLQFLRADRDEQERIAISNFQECAKMDAKVRALAAESDLKSEQNKFLAVENDRLQTIIYKNILPYRQQGFIPGDIDDLVAATSRHMEEIKREVGARAVEGFVVYATSQSGFVCDLTVDDAEDYAARIRAGEVQP